MFLLLLFKSSDPFLKEFKPVHCSQSNCLDLCVFLLSPSDADYAWADTVEIRETVVDDAWTDAVEIHRIVDDDA